MNVVLGPMISSYAQTTCPGPNIDNMFRPDVLCVSSSMFHAIEYCHLDCKFCLR